MEPHQGGTSRSHTLQPHQGVKTMQPHQGATPRGHIKEINGLWLFSTDINLQDIAACWRAQLLLLHFAHVHSF